MKVRRPVKIVRFRDCKKPPCGFAENPTGKLQWSKWRGRYFTVYADPQTSRLHGCESPFVWEITPQTRYLMRLPKLDRGYYVACSHQIILNPKRPKRTRLR